MKSAELHAEFPGIPLKQFKELLFDDTSFQQHVHKTQGHSNVNISQWTETYNDGSKQEKTRTVTFDSPFDAPGAVKKFVGMEVAQGITSGKMTVYGTNLQSPAHAEIHRVEVETVMNITNGALKDQMVVHIHWIAVPSQCGRGTILQQIIRCEFRKWIPMIQGSIESSSLNNAQKTFENWVVCARQRCASAS